MAQETTRLRDVAARTEATVASLSQENPSDGVPSRPVQANEIAQETTRLGDMASRTEATIASIANAPLADSNASESASSNTEPPPPEDIHHLVKNKEWDRVIERCTTHPQEVGSSHRTDRGFTPLHAVAGYNRDVDGERELVPVVRAILHAAEAIDFGRETEDGTRRAGGSGGAWRMVFDQKTRPCWSPLHLLYVSGGMINGKIAMTKALLQMDQDSDELATDSENGEPGRVKRLKQRKLLTLLDRQNRNVLHHLLDIAVPSEQSFEVAHFLLEMEPSLALQRDTRGKSPLVYVADRLIKTPGARSRVYITEAGETKNYTMLKLLIGAMERNDRSVSQPGAATAGNIFHSALRLPRQVCPALDLFLELIWKMEPGGINFEKDEDGNTPLHIFASNKYYSAQMHNEDFNERQAMEDADVVVVNKLYPMQPEAISQPNKDGKLPLQLAIESGRRGGGHEGAISVLISWNPLAILLTPGLESVKLYPLILATIANSEKMRKHRNLEAVFSLLRARPDVVDFTSHQPTALPIGKPLKKKWWKKMNPLS